MVQLRQRSCLRTIRVLSSPAHPPPRSRHPLPNHQAFEAQTRQLACCRRSLPPGTSWADVPVLENDPMLVYIPDGAGRSRLALELIIDARALMAPVLGW